MGRKRIEITDGALLEAYATGKSTREVAADYGICVSVVQRRISKLGEMRQQNYNSIPAATIEEVQTLLKQGFHHSEVARLTGVGMRRVCAEKAALGLVHKLTDVQKCEIIRMRRSGTKMREIARLLGLTDYAVCNYLMACRKKEQRAKGDGVCE